MAKASGWCVLVILTANILSAQTGSEYRLARERLNYFLGTWNVEMHMKTGALNSRVYSATEHNEWAPDHSLLLSKPEADRALPEGGIAVMGYSSTKHTYTYHILKSTGDSEDLQGTVEDRTWTWLSDEARTGRESTKTRITMKEISPTSYTLRVETLPAGGIWFTVMEGTVKKIVAHSHQDVAFLR
jgi:hypothetical protein